MTPEQVKGITRQFTEQPKSDKYEVHFIDSFFEREWKKQNPSEQPKSFVALSTHYQKPIDNGMVVDLQPDFEVKSITDKDSFDVAYKTGYLDAVKHAGEFVKQLMSGGGGRF